MLQTKHIYHINPNNMFACFYTVFTFKHELSEYVIEALFYSQLPFLLLILTFFSSKLSLITPIFKDTKPAEVIE